MEERILISKYTEGSGKQVNYQRGLSSVAVPLAIDRSSTGNYKGIKSSLHVSYSIASKVAVVLRSVRF